MTRRRTLPAIALVLLLASCRRETPGSAPVRAVGDHAVIGDTPAAFRFDEPIVVQDATKGGLTQYYDAAAAG